MSKGLKGCLFAGAAFYLVVAAILITVKLLEVPDLNSAPSISRDVPGFDSGSLGLLKEASRKVEQVHPASKEMDTPERYPGKDGSFVLVWPEEEIVSAGSPPDPWVSEFQGDDELELVAFATWIPGPDDALPDEAPKSFPLRFHDAETLAPLSEAELDELGIPPAMRKIRPPREYHTPRIRLLFRNSGMEFVRVNGINIGDSRTGARVGYDLESLGELDQRAVTRGKWTRVDAALLIWHDSPLTCRVQVLTGEPQRADLKQAIGEEVLFGDSLRIQWLGQMEREPDASTYLHSYRPVDPVTKKQAEELEEKFQHQSYRDTRALLVTQEKEESDTPYLLLRTSSGDLLEDHVSVLGGGKPKWDWERTEEEGNLYLATIRDKTPRTEPVSLVFLPHITELVLEIPGIPDAPNPRNVEDLFDITLPRITLPSDLSDAERHLIGYISVATQVRWDSSRKWGDVPPKNLPSDYTFYNETPQSLLIWYLDNTKGSFIRYREEEYTLYVNEREETWWSKQLDNWLSFIR